MKRTKSRFEALILDMDGVLIDSEPYHFQAFRQIFKSLDIDIPDPYLFRLVGDPLSQNLRDISDDFGIDFNLEVYARRIKESYRRLIEEAPLRARDEVWPLLEKARSLKWQTGLCTTSPYEQVNLLLPRITPPLDSTIREGSVFDSIVALEDVSHAKPHPEPYALSAKRLDLRPQQCVVVEDSQAGILSAKRAGCYCFGLRTPYNQHQDFSDADVVLDHLKEMKIEAAS